MTSIPPGLSADHLHCFIPGPDTKTCSNLSATVGIPIIPGETLLFIDEIQDCVPAIMSLRYFKEDYPELHVIAAGSLLEFAMEDIPSFAVGRIRSLYMYPFSFEEFMNAQGLGLQMDAVRSAGPDQPLIDALHKQLNDQVRSFILVGGMPEAVSTWVETHDYLACAYVHNDIMETYQDDFNKYKKRISPDLTHLGQTPTPLSAESSGVRTTVISIPSTSSPTMHRITLSE